MSSSSIEFKMNVIKRNGEEVTFDKSKIVNAIKKANNEVPPIHQLNDFQITAIADNIVSVIVTNESFPVSPTQLTTAFSLCWIRSMKM